MRQAAFIGSGNMGGALIRAACRAIGPDQVIIADHQAEKAAALAAELGCAAAADNAAAVEGAEVIFLCVKPQVLSGVAAALVPVLNACHGRGEDKTLVSIAAGVEIAAVGGFLKDI